MVEGETTIQFPGIRDMEYWGGFFDVLLYFDIVKRRVYYRDPGSRDTVDNLTYHPVIAVFSSDRGSLNSLKEVVPGNIYPRYKEVPGEEYQKWSLVLRKQVTCYQFLRSIMPVLYYKREQAEIMEDFLRQKREVFNKFDSYGDPIVAALRTKVLTDYLDQWQELNSRV